MKLRIAASLAGLSLVAPLLPFLLASIFPRAGTGTPPIWFPMPAIVFIGLLFGLRFAAFFVPAVAFFLWNPGLLQGEVAVPKRSYLLLALAALADAIWCAAGWKNGLGFQGATYTYSVCAINLVWVGFLCLGFVGSLRGQCSFRRNLLLHWMLFAWLAWSAFPFFGEFI